MMTISAVINLRTILLRAISALLVGLLMLTIAPTQHVLGQIQVDEIQDVPNERELRANGFIFFDPGARATSAIIGEDCTFQPGAPISPIEGDETIDPAWIQTWNEAGSQYGVDPKILGSIYAAEHGGGFPPITGDGGSAAQGGWLQPSSSSATGPFQILDDTWDWIRTLDPTLPPRTNRGPSDPRNDVLLASRGAAVYLDFMGAPVGLPAGSSDQEFIRIPGPSGYQPERTGGEDPWTVASLAGRYNQGPYWDGSTSAGVNFVFMYIDDAVAAYIFLGGEEDTGGSLGNCGSGGGSGQVILNGYAFPIAGFQNEVTSGYTWPCPSVCHHDGTPGFDLAHEYDDTSTGIPVYAIYDGVIQNFRTSYQGQEGCNSYQLFGDDGWHYWYGHTQVLASAGIENDRIVQSAEQIAVIGERRCTGNGSYPHLHIDRGFPMGRNGGSDCCRDLGFVDLINAMWELLPVEGVL